VHSPQAIPPRPVAPSAIADAAGALTAAELSGFNSRIEGMHRDGLGRVAVAIVRSIGDEPPQRMARRILREWKVGDDPRTLPMGRVDAVLLLLVLESPEDVRCAVAAGGSDGAEDFEEKVGEMCRRAVSANLGAGQLSRPVGAALGVTENRLRTYAGIGLVPGTEAPTLQPSTSSQVRSAAGSLSKWLFGGLAAFALVALTAVAIQRRMRNSLQKCEKCGKTMAEAPEETRLALLDATMRHEELLGNVRHIVCACVCGETRVWSIRR
jgi:uncharacterized membrane protein YgcG